ncbi:MAG: hypothetical protein WDZ41_04875 [Candidatus Babeliales bacterium]
MMKKYQNLLFTAFFGLSSLFLFKESFALEKVRLSTITNKTQEDLRVTIDSLYGFSSKSYKRGLSPTGTTNSSFQVDLQSVAPRYISKKMEVKTLSGKHIASKYGVIAGRDYEIVELENGSIEIREQKTK